MTCVWRRLDEPGMEVAHVESFSSAVGTQIGVGYELHWRLAHDRLQLEVVGGALRTVELGEHDFFDVFASPFFNSLPVTRDGLLEAGPAREYTMAFVDVPSLEVTASPQLYTPRGNRVVAFASGSFEADIVFDVDGFVMTYEGFLERVS
jgi:uncharacterized protein